MPTNRPGDRDRPRRTCHHQAGSDAGARRAIQRAQAQAVATMHRFEERLQVAVGPLPERAGGRHRPACVERLAQLHHQAFPLRVGHRSARARPSVPPSAAVPGTSSVRVGGTRVNRPCGERTASGAIPTSRPISFSSARVRPSVRPAPGNACCDVSRPSRRSLPPPRHCSVDQSSAEHAFSQHLDERRGCQRPEYRVVRQVRPGRVDDQQGASRWLRPSGWRRARPLPSAICGSLAAARYSTRSEAARGSAGRARRPNHRTVVPPDTGAQRDVSAKERRFEQQRLHDEQPRERFAHDRRLARRAVATLHVGHQLVANEGSKGRRPPDPRRDRAVLRPLRWVRSGRAAARYSRSRRESRDGCA